MFELHQNSQCTLSMVRSFASKEELAVFIGQQAKTSVTIAEWHRAGEKVGNPAIKQEHGAFYFFSSMLWDHGDGPVRYCEFKLK